VIRSRLIAPVGVAASLFALLAGCSSIEKLTSGDKIDYRSAAVTHKSLDVPPDLTQLGRDPRFQASPSGTVTASSFQSGASAVAPAVSGPPMTVSAAAPSTAAPGAAAPSPAASSPAASSPAAPSAAAPSAAAPAAAAASPAAPSPAEPAAAAPIAAAPTTPTPNAATPTAAAAPPTPPADEARIERAGSQRWMTTRLTPEQLWPQLRTFWQERGFNLVLDEPATGVMETDWAEDRAKLPNDLIRSTLGRLIESFYSTGERDKFRTRVERTPNGSEVYISHRGLVEVYVGTLRENTMWQSRPADPQLEAEFLARLTQKLNTKEEPGKATAAAKPQPAAPVAARARLLEDAPGAAMQIDEGFDRAWRRVGLALDRTGFTVEDRDRSGGLYFVRYIDPAQAAKEEKGIFSRMFGGSKSTQSPSRYRIAVKASGDRTTVSVLDAQGAPEAGDVGKRIVALLVEDLK
jgi:outer membrane protein assembly factor BamC